MATRPIDPDSPVMRRHLEARTGKSFAAWIGIARSLGSASLTDVVNYLKEAGPMSHGYASTIAHEARKAGVVAEEDPVDALFKGPAAALRPIYDLLARYVKTIGRDVELVPKRDYVSVRRGKQFALVMPAATRIDLGIHLPGVPATDRLALAGTWNGMVSHRVRLAAEADVDLALKAWLKQAYDRAQ